MTDHKQSVVHIGQLNLRVPGADDGAGQRVGNHLAEKLARGLPAGISGHIGALSIRVPVNSGATESEITSAVSQSIIGALSKANNSPAFKAFTKEQKG